MLGVSAMCEREFQPKSPPGEDWWRIIFYLRPSGGKKKLSKERGRKKRMLPALWRIVTFFFQKYKKQQGTRLHFLCTSCLQALSMMFVFATIREERNRAASSHISAVWRDSSNAVLLNPKVPGEGVDLSEMV